MMQQTCSKRKIREGTYSVYRIDNDEMIICGTVREICERLDITKSCVSKAVKNHSVVRRKYRIYYLDEIDEEV